jgi:DNA-binding transcriptional ArsR family regulator
VNISSLNKDEFYPPPEFKNILTLAENLKTEISTNWIRGENTSSYQKIIEYLEALLESLLLHYKEYYTIERAFVEAFLYRLTEKQRIILRWFDKNYKEETVYTSLIERLSIELGVPKSTVRWNLRGLRETGLIKAGDKNNKGIPVELTYMGRVISENISDIY